jgi:hypothetical protein
LSAADNTDRLFYHWQKRAARRTKAVAALVLLSAGNAIYQVIFYNVATATRAVTYARGHLGVALFTNKHIGSGGSSV